MEPFSDFDDIQVEDLFHPSQEDVDPSMGTFETDFEESLSPVVVGNGLKEDMEKYQKIFLFSSPSPGPWTSKNDLQPTLTIQDPMETIAKESTIAVNIGQELNSELYSEWKNKNKSASLNAEALAANSPLGSSSFLPSTFDAAPVEAAPLPWASARTGGKVTKGGKEKTKGKTMENSKISKENNFFMGSKHYLTNRSVMNPAMEKEKEKKEKEKKEKEKEEERRKRRKDSNRRAAEKYRTKLKTSALDIATEQKRLALENEKLKVVVELFRRHLSGVYDVIDRHQRHCACPTQLPVHLTCRPEAEKQDSGHDIDLYDPGSLPSTAGSQVVELEDPFQLDDCSEGPPAHWLNTSDSRILSRLYRPSQDVAVQSTARPADAVSNRGPREVEVPGGPGTQYLAGIDVNNASVPDNSFGHLQVLSFYLKAENQQQLQYQDGELKVVRATDNNRQLEKDNW